VSAPRDARGCEVTGASPRALEHYERALGGFLAWNGEPRGEARSAVEAAPEFVMGHVLEAELHLSSRNPADMQGARRWRERGAFPPMRASACTSRRSPPR
jgi:hypothetical protein